MIEIRLILHDAAELAKIHNAVMKIEDQRNARFRPQAQESAGAVATINGPFAGPSEAVLKVAHAAQVNNPPVPVVPTLAELETALRDFLARHGNDLAPARKVLDTFGLAKLSDAAGLVDIGRIELLEALTK